MTVRSSHIVGALEGDPLAGSGPDDRTWRTMGEEAFEWLRGAILSGALAPGEVLRIDDLCLVSGMSRMPIREALAQLQRVGLVERKPRRMAQVAALSRADLRDVFDARLILEVSAISAAAAEFGDEDIAGARRCLDQLRGKLREGDRARAGNAHAALHLTLYRAARSRWLVRLVQPLWCNAERYLEAFVGSTGALLEAEMGEHERLLAACEAGESDAAATVLWNHLVRAGNLVACRMGGDPLYEQRSVPA
ncbi:MAG: GntR family transcriptional regulator [Actinobacteria bacterium]|nr:GntR family transcriptional regulator [Actinomycetota bacterium]